MPEEEKLPTFNEQKMDLEIDFKERGGVQRFGSVSDFKQWLKEEREFWNWLGQVQGNHNFRVDQFNSCIQDSQQHLNQSAGEWDKLQDELKRLRKHASGGDADQAKLSQEQLRKKEGAQNLILDDFSKNVKRSIEDHANNRKSHIFRHEPEALYVTSIADEDQLSAIHTLGYFILDRQSPQQNGVQHLKGRFLAEMFTQGLKANEGANTAAFTEAIQTWNRELADYKNKYEEKLSEFETLTSKNQSTTKAWEVNTEEMATKFSEQLQKNDQDLSNLKETYEAYMVLKGPMKYWGLKRKDHDNEIKKLRKMLVVWSCVGAVVLFAAAYFLLPAFHPAESIPWRHIGFFILTSTFVLWFIRLLVKLLLSNIHLSADAREREVMIQTFMALMRHKESRDGVTKEDIALVLAPIFKPSTTGVIKDEGGPITLSDFIARMGGK